MSFLVAIEKMGSYSMVFKEGNIISSLRRQNFNWHLMLKKKKKILTSATMVLSPGPDFIPEQDFLKASQANPLAGLHLV